MNGTRQRDWSVYPVWISDAPTMEYAKVRALDGALGIGRRAQVQRGQREWVSGRVVEHPDGLDGHGGGTVWITFDAEN